VLYTRSPGSNRIIIIISISHKLLIDAELYDLVLAPRLGKKDTMVYLGSEFGNPWGQCSSSI
jgi:hypothetical protein